MGVDVAAVMDALRELSREKRIAPQEGNVPLFNRAFLETVKFFGRTYDIAMIAAYKIGTFKLMDDTEKFPSMLKKRKISLLPSFRGDGKVTRRIFKKAEERKEAGE
jgi:heterodisulfide reductase subunit C